MDVPTNQMGEIFHSLSAQFRRSVMSNSLRPHGLKHARPPCPSSNSWNLPKPMSTESVITSNHLILCRPLLLLPSIFPGIRVFSNESALHIRWPKYCSFSFSISPSSECSGLISFRMDWLISLLSKGLPRVFSNTTVRLSNIFLPRFWHIRNIRRVSYKYRCLNPIPDLLN